MRKGRAILVGFGALWMFAAVELEWRRIARPRLAEHRHHQVEFAGDVGADFPAHRSRRPKASFDGQGSNALEGASILP